MLGVNGSLMFNTILLMVQKHNITEVSNETYSETFIPDSERCYGRYGCFSVKYPWLSEERPIALFPHTDVLKVRYPSFSRRNMKMPNFLDPEDMNSIRAANLNPNGPFYFISHGYVESGDRVWIQKMTQNLLTLDENADATVIAVDWRKGASPPYSQAVANIRLIGAITAHLIYNIYKELGLKNLDNFHYIGHSLGAHNGGYTGHTLRKEFGLTLGRITGLDPAEPHFGKTQTIVRLDRSDAKFVDIIHTDASPFMSGGLGMWQSIGHIDYFPNGGNIQPGCSQRMIDYINSKDGSLFRSLKHFLGCDHIRSYEYFSESIMPACPFMAIQCPSYQHFLHGHCFKCGVNGHHCIPFGYRSFRGYQRLLKSRSFVPENTVNAYFMTGESEEFCRMQYRVTVNISASMESSSHGGDIGRLCIILVNKNGTHSNKIPLETSPGYHKPGTQKTYMVPIKDIGEPVSALVEWEFVTNLLNPLTWRILMSPRLYIAWLSIDSMEYKTSITICPENEEPVLANTQSHFKEHHCHNVFPQTIKEVDFK